MKIKLRKLNAIGAAHLLLPLMVLVGAGIVGSFVAVKSISHADALKGGPVRAYSGYNDGCGGNATHYSDKKLKTHVDSKNFGNKSVCLCNNGKVRVYTKKYSDAQMNPACDKKAKKNKDNASANSGKATKANNDSNGCTNGNWSTEGYSGTSQYKRCKNGKWKVVSCALGKKAIPGNQNGSVPCVKPKAKPVKETPYQRCMRTGGKPSITNIGDGWVTCTTQEGKAYFRDH